MSTDGIAAIRRALAAAGGATFRVEPAEEAGLLKNAALPWRIVWH